jgi:hypothetical protein
MMIALGHEKTAHIAVPRVTINFWISKENNNSGLDEEQQQFQHDDEPKTWSGTF